MAWFRYKSAHPSGDTWKYIDYDIPPFCTPANKKKLCAELEHQIIEHHPCLYDAGIILQGVKFPPLEVFRQKLKEAIANSEYWNNKAVQYKNMLQNKPKIM